MNIILNLLGLLFVVMIVNLIISKIKMEPDVKQIVWLIVGVLLLLALLATLGLFPGYNGIVFIDRGVR